MPVPIIRYTPSRQYLWAGLVAMAIAAFSVWVALRWEYAWIAAGLAVLSSMLCLSVGLAPAIEIHQGHVRFGRRTIPWSQIRRLDRAAAAPLIVRCTLNDKRTVTLFYAGDPESTKSLLRHLRKFSREAAIDGVPYKEFWGESIVAAPDRKQLPPPRPLLLPDDEAEIERMFQRLKTVGHIDSSAGPNNAKSSGPKSSSPKGSTPREDK